MLLDTPLCDFGWEAPDFTLNDFDGKAFTMSEQLGEKGLLICFISNHCPYVQEIGSRLAADTKELMALGINVLAIMSNDYRIYESDSPPYMKQFAKHFGFSFPYLVDEGQQVAKAFGAVCTPDFFGLNKNGQLHYRGRLDDAGMNYRSSRTPELLNAMIQIAETGQGPEKQMPSIGCSIKWSHR